MKPIFAVLIAALAVLAAGQFGLTQMLGAHPWWAAQVTWVGVPIGLVVAGCWHWLRLSRAVGAALSLILLLCTLGLAHTGKRAFAASYAEDQFAGQLWYFGWIGAAIFATVALFLILSRPRIKID